MLVFAGMLIIFYSLSTIHNTIKLKAFYASLFLFVKKDKSTLTFSSFILCKTFWPAMLPLSPFLVGQLKLKFNGNKKRCAIIIIILAMLRITLNKCKINFKCIWRKTLYHFTVKQEKHDNSSRSLKNVNQAICNMTIYKCTYMSRWRVPQIKTDKEAFMFILL